MAKLLSPRQAGEKYGLPHREVIRRIHTKDIRARKLGGWNWVINEDELVEDLKADWYTKNHK